MTQIFKFPVTKEAEERLAAQGERRMWVRETEAALQRPGYILIAWAVSRYGFVDVLSAWYLPEDGKRWVYKWEYDMKTMKEADTSSRSSCLEVYQWLKEEHRGLFKERHICVPPYILLDNKELRTEYLAGRLDGGLASTQVAKSL
jgi:hypothetical protein